MYNFSILIQVINDRVCFRIIGISLTKQKWNRSIGDTLSIRLIIRSVEITNFNYI